MVKNLDDDFEFYDVNSNHMVSFDSNFKIGDFRAYNSEFLNFNQPADRKIILINTQEDKQIFQMKDGKFILEIEDGDYCRYYYSYNLEELINYSED